MFFQREQELNAMHKGVRYKVIPWTHRQKMAAGKQEW